MKVCTIEGCSRKHEGRGYCQFHLYRVRNGKDLLAPSRNMERRGYIDGDIAYIPIGPNAIGGYSLVNKEFIRLDKYKWNSDNRGYAMSHINKHKKLLQYMIIGDPIKGLCIDHINRNKLDNRKENLRYISPTDNIINSNKRCDNNSGYKGVWYCNTNKKRVARIEYNKKRISLGNYSNKEEAIEARKKAEKIYHII